MYREAVEVDVEEVRDIIRAMRSLLVLPFSVLLACSGDSSQTSDAGDASSATDSPSPGDASTDQSSDAKTDAISQSDGAACTDPCPAPNGGVTLGCEKRFWYGENYAWKNFAIDFGGLAQWGSSGVAAAPAGYLTDLQTMKADGANVIRWWMFADFRGDGVQFDSSDLPTGLGSTVLADVEKALELADQANVFIQFTFFSFDAFNPTTTNNGVKIRSIAPIATSATNTQKLVTNVVRPIVKAATASAHANRIAAWEIINEPEWAITGTDPYGDQAFTPNNSLTTVTFAQMETFVKAIAAGIAAESTAYVTIGGSAPKWAKAWTQSNLTLYQWHYYDWINQYWPYTDGPSKYGITLPVIVGELPNSGFTQPSVASWSTVMNAYYGKWLRGRDGLGSHGHGIRIGDVASIVRDRELVHDAVLAAASAGAPAAKRNVDCDERDPQRAPLHDRRARHPDLQILTAASRAARSGIGHLTIFSAIHVGTLRALRASHASLDRMLGVDDVGVWIGIERIDRWRERLVRAAERPVDLGERRSDLAAAQRGVGQRGERRVGGRRRRRVPSLEWNGMVGGGSVDDESHPIDLGIERG